MGLPCGRGLLFSALSTGTDDEDAETRGKAVSAVPKIIKTLGQQSTDGSSVDNAAILFSILSNAVRLSVILRVIRREWSVGELAADLNIGQSALSQHLGKMRQSGVVYSRRERRTIYYRCSHQTVISLLAEAGLTRSSLMP